MTDEMECGHFANEGAEWFESQEFFCVDCVKEAAYQQGKVETMKLMADMNCIYCMGLSSRYQVEAVPDVQGDYFRHFGHGVSDGVVICQSSKIRRQLEKESE